MNKPKACMGYLEIAQPISTAAERAEAKAGRAERAAKTPNLGLANAIRKTYRHYQGESGHQPNPHLDGSTIIIRNLAKMAAYSTALWPAAISATLLAMRLANKTKSPEKPANPTNVNATAAAMDVNGTAPAMPGGPNNAANMAEVANVVHASSITLTLIGGWMARGLVLTPAYEHLFHRILAHGSNMAGTVQKTLGITPRPPEEPPKDKLKRQLKEGAQKLRDTLADARQNSTTAQQRTTTTTHSADTTTTTIHPVNTTTTTTSTTGSTRTMPTETARSVTTQVPLVRRNHNIDGESSEAASDSGDEGSSYSEGESGSNLDV